MDKQNAKKKVLHLITLSEKGGATENTALTILGQKDEFVVHIACSGNGELIKRAKRANIQVHRLDFMKKELSPFYDLVALIQIWLLMRKHKFQIVHTHSSKAGILGRFGAKLAGVPTIIHTVHGLPFHDFQGRVQHLLYLWAERLAGFFTHRLIVVSPQVGEKAARKLLINKKKISVIYSGMDIDKFAESEKSTAKREICTELQLDESEILILALTRLVPLKGIDRLLEFFKLFQQKYPKSNLIIAGDGPEKETLIAKKEQLGLEKAHFLGIRQDSARLLSACDLLVHTSYLEGLPRVLPEAMLCGIPWVAFGVDGTRDASGKNHRGISVPPGDINQLFKACELLIENPEFRADLIRHGQIWARKRYDHNAMVKRINKVYKDSL